MNATTTARLERLRNRGTLYEIAATNAETGRSVFVMYGQTSASSIVRGLVREKYATVPGQPPPRSRLDRLAEETGTAMDSWRRDRTGVYSGPWRIRLTGRTQRQAIIEGEMKDSIYNDKENAA